MFSLPPRKPLFFVFLRNSNVDPAGLPENRKIHTGRRDIFSISPAILAKNRFDFVAEERCGPRPARPAPPQQKRPAILDTPVLV